MTIAAASGLGLALLPCLLGDAEPALRRLTPAVLATRALSLAYRREARLSEQLRAVIRFVTHLIDHHAARIGGVRE
jgi:DNA-binding transcriptional LysR family regulator